MKFTSAFALFALPVLAAANPVARTEPSGQCNTGPVQCCEQVEKAGNPAIAGVLALIGVVVSGVNVPIGLGCSPITVIGGGGSQCQANAVCCENNAVGGLVSIGCLPLDISV